MPPPPLTAAAAAARAALIAHPVTDERLASYIGLWALMMTAMMRDGARLGRRRSSLGGDVMGWTLKGQVVVACNCDYGCPCNFNAPPTTGKCEGGWTWHVEDGSYDDVPLDGLNFSVYANWPGAIHEGDGEALILVDERADEAQRGAIATLVGGKVGGPWGVLGWTWPTIHGPIPVPYEVDFAGLDTRVRAGDAVELQLAPIRNPVTGDETHPGVVLPTGIIFRQADLGASSTFRVQDGISYDHSGQYTAVGPFDYAGP